MPDFIQKAVKNKGAFRKQAERAGMSTAAYAKYVLAPKNAKKTTERTKRRARLAQTLMKLKK